MLSVNMASLIKLISILRFNNVNCRCAAVDLNKQKTLEHLHRILATRLINTFAVICIISLPISLYRWYDIGYQPVFIHHIILSLATFSVCACQNRFRAKSVIIFVVALLASMTISGGMTFGLQSGTVTFAIFTTFIIFFVWGVKLAIAYLVSWCLFLTTLAYLVTHELFSLGVVPSEYSLLPSAWAIVIIGTLITAVFILVMGTTFFKEFDRLLEQLSQQKSALSQLANKDPLTGLMNLRAGKEHFLKMTARADREHYRVAMLFIDLDKFKQVNDTHGHDVGDRTLIELSQNMVHQLREYDVALRVGGDEFIVLLSDIKDDDQAIEISERMLNGMQKASVVPPFIHPEVSIGIAFYPDDGKTFNQLKYYADNAMYVAKKDVDEHIVINSENNLN